MFVSSFTCEDASARLCVHCELNSQSRGNLQQEERSQKNYLCISVCAVSFGKTNCVYVCVCLSSGLLSSSKSPLCLTSDPIPPTPAL